MGQEKISFFKKYFTILKNSVLGFADEDSLKYSASLAYYTVFSLGPILVLIISLAGIFLGEDAIKGKVFSEFAVHVELQEIEREVASIPPAPLSTNEREIEK